MQPTQLLANQLPERYTVSMRIINYTITEKENESTILHFLQEQGYSHQNIVRLKKTPEGILLNQTWAYVNQTLTEGDRLTVRIPEEPRNNRIPAESYPLSIPYEDEDLICVNKPAHMPIHPSMNHHTQTLTNAIFGYQEEHGEEYPFRCMNRLDRDTTGLTLIAKHGLSASVLGEQVKNRSLHRTYLAICEGLLPEQGTIQAPIARKENSSIERIVDPCGESAVTHFQRLFYRADLSLSLAALQLETGRTHQIRVHMKHIGHPLIGDYLYHPNYAYIKRQALHSCRLTFLHPVTRELLTLYAPMPPDMSHLFPEFCFEDLQKI